HYHVRLPVMPASTLSPYTTLFRSFRDGEYVWEFDFKSKCLWLRYSTVWFVLETEYSFDYNDVHALVRSEVEKYFKCRGVAPEEGDRKSTRLNSSHVKITYAVFCLK